MRGLVPTPWVVATALLIVAGIVLLVASGGDDTAGVVGFGLLGLGAILGTALAFYAVGRSEDVERESRERGG
jgi:drug/metabolite transporter (DMT)-like permease